MLLAFAAVGAVVWSHSPEGPFVLYTFIVFMVLGIADYSQEPKASAGTFGLPLRALLKFYNCTKRFPKRLTVSSLFALLEVPSSRLIPC